MGLDETRIPRLESQGQITITVIGSRQADGSIKATTIQIGSAAPSSGFSNQATSQ